MKRILSSLFRHQHRKILLRRYRAKRRHLSLKLHPLCPTCCGIRIEPDFRLTIQFVAVKRRQNKETNMNYSADGRECMTGVPKLYLTRAIITKMTRNKRRNMYNYIANYGGQIYAIRVYWFN